MIPSYLHPGDMIGICAPCHVAKPDFYAQVQAAIEAHDYRVRLANNLFQDGWGYASTPEARAADLNQLINDDEVKLICFGGGEGAVDILPFVDWTAAKTHPKRWMSYSDGTDLLNTLWSKTGITAFYGQTSSSFIAPSDYNLEQFRRMMEAPLPKAHLAAAPWHTVVEGCCEGVLMGGYLDNFVFLNCAGWATPPADLPVILFVEDHQRFFGIEHESALLARLEQSPVMKQVTGLLFGHYGYPTNEQLLQRLRILGERHHIPVAYCDDFGHGDHCAILPIGVSATLDATHQHLLYHP